MKATKLVWWKGTDKEFHEYDYWGAKLICRGDKPRFKWINLGAYGRS